MKKKKLSAILAVIVIAVGCAGPGTDAGPGTESAPTPESMPEPSPETIESPVQEDHEDYEITDQQDVSIDYKDYGIDYETTDMNFHEFPLNKLVAYYLGGDGAYSYGANFELHDRFIANPDEILKYIALVGDNIIRDEPAKVWLCDALVYRYFYDDTYTIDSFRELLDQLEEIYKFESPEIEELLLLMRNKLEEVIEYNY